MGTCLPFAHVGLCSNAVRLPRLVFLALLAWAAGGAHVLAQEPGAARTPSLQRLKVQLSWSHQTQFAGFYIAQRSGHFARGGLDVELVPGSAALNPIEALQRGTVDVAISTLHGALAASDARRPVTNIAQIFQASPTVLMCRPSLGVATAEDIFSRKVGVAGSGDLQLVEAILRRVKPGAPPVQTVPRDGTGRLLIQGEAPCITGVVFNELLRVQNAGVPYTDLLVLRPEAFGVHSLGDGLYVKSERLGDPLFRNRMVNLLRALEEGWNEARIYPSLAVAATLERNPALDIQFQHQALEQVLDLIPSRDFGLLRLDALEAVSADLSALPENRGQPSPGVALPAYAWTHDIWSDLQRVEGTAEGMSPSTRHALTRFSRNPEFRWLVIIGTLLFGLGGAMLAIERGYNFWGRLLVAVLPALGGGTIRDFLIGGPRLPLFYIADPSLPLCLLAIVLAASAAVAAFPDLRRTRGFALTMRYTGVVGSAVIATNGAIVTLLADVPWIWVPVFAAISCAGGGLLLDIVSNDPPRAFRGSIFEAEERGLVGGIVLLLVLWVANQMHEPHMLVFLGAVISILTNIWVGQARALLQSWYPAWLMARRETSAG